MATAEKLCDTCEGRGLVHVSARDGKGVELCPECRSPEGDVLSRGEWAEAMRVWRVELEADGLGRAAAARDRLQANYEALRALVERYGQENAALRARLAAAERERDELGERLHSCETMLRRARTRYAALRDAVLEAIHPESEWGRVIVEDHDERAIVRDHEPLRRAYRLAEGDGG